MSTYFPSAGPPKSNMFISHCSFNNKKQFHVRAINSHPFNHRIQLFIPTALSLDIQSSITQSFLSNNYYYYANLPLKYLLTSPFLQYARNGMTALSLNGGIDTHDLVCLDGKGKLILSLTKDSYEQFGLSGTPSTFYRDRQRYTIEIDLTAPSMIPGKPGFDRIKWCFENTLVSEFPMVLAIVDPQGDSFPIEFPETIKATKMSFSSKFTPLDNIIIPDTTSIRTIAKNEITWRKNVSDIYEWVGMASIQSDRIVMGNNVDPFLCVYSPPPQATSDITSSSGCLIEISGLISSYSIVSILNSFRVLLNQPSNSINWANLTVWGFQDAPISWRNKEHGHLMTGENMYSIFLWPSSNLPQENIQDPDTYVLLESVAAHDNHS